MEQLKEATNDETDRMKRKNDIGPILFVQLALVETNRLEGICICSNTQNAWILPRRKNKTEDYNKNNNCFIFGHHAQPKKKAADLKWLRHK